MSFMTHQLQTGKEMSNTQISMQTGVLLQAATVHNRHFLTCQ